MDTEVRLVEQFFGERLSPDLIQLVAQTDFRRLHDFREVQRGFDRSYRLPPRAPMEYRPYISADVLTFEDLNRGLTVGETTRFYESHDPGAVFKAADSLQQHLLFCHTVVLNSPLGFICDLFFDTKSENFEEWRAYLSRYLTFLNYVRPLVESGILVLLPRRFHIRTPSLILTDAYRARIVETADFASIRRATSTKLTPTEFFKLQREVYVS
jgi:hypothetical protein